MMRGGRKWTAEETDLQVSPSLSENESRAITKDSMGRVWIQ